MKLFVEVDVVVIVPALVLHHRASFSFYVCLYSHGDWKQHCP